MCRCLMIFVILLAVIVVILPASCKPSSEQSSPASQTQPSLPSSPPMSQPTPIPSPVAENRPPFIMRLVPDGWSGVQGTSTKIGMNITCEAYDPDGDTISFSWEANEGTITGTGREVEWLIPAKPGRYVIQVTASDEKDGKSSASMADDLESVQVVGTTCHTSGGRSFNYEGH